MTTTRQEHDSLGSRDIDATAYYGIQTLRAVENFPITEVPLSIQSTMVRMLAMVKKACALSNAELGKLEQSKADAIAAACDELIDGKLHEQFVVDVIQGGAGTSSNMNANEVIANRALELLGHAKGKYDFLHPNNDVNCSQSTNDVYPSALRLALVSRCQPLLESMRQLQDAFRQKGEEFASVRKIGRTQLQDAVPMTLGMEFHAFATAIGEDVEQLQQSSRALLAVNLGATAIGTGINTPPGYTERVIQHLRAISGLDVRLAENLIEATWDAGDFVQLSGTLKRYATKISKICNDLRLLSSGPRCGFNEINLPKRQPGSSIMPGKVNPVIPEVVNQIAFDVIGKDVTVSMAAEAGQLQLNAFEPVIANALFLGLRMLDRGSSLLAERCVVGITANEDVCEQAFDSSLQIATALNPVLGYETTSQLVQEALRDKRSIRELVLEKNLLDEARLNKILQSVF